jgi:hypothetical protein
MKNYLSQFILLTLNKGYVVRKLKNKYHFVNDGIGFDVYESNFDLVFDIFPEVGKNDNIKINFNPLVSKSILSTEDCLLKIEKCNENN